MPVTNLVVDLSIRYGFQVLGAIVILVAAGIVAKWTGAVIDRRLTRQAMEPPMRVLIVRVIRITVLLFGVVVALDKFGFQIAPLVAGIGVAGLGVGLALQGVLSNIMAGLTIIFTKPFRVGEHIEILGVRGDVLTIDLSSTTLANPDQSRIVIPNRKIVGEILHNFGHTRQLKLTVTLPHAADVQRVLGVARDVVLANPRILKDPMPLLGVSQITETALQIAVQPWVAVSECHLAEAELYEALVGRLRSAGVQLPIAYHEVRLLDGVR